MTLYAALTLANPSGADDGSTIPAYELPQVPRVLVPDLSDSSFWTVVGPNKVLAGTIQWGTLDEDAVDVIRAVVLLNGNTRTISDVVQKYATFPGLALRPRRGMAPAILPGNLTVPSSGTVGSAVGEVFLSGYPARVIGGRRRALKWPAVMSASDPPVLTTPATTAATTTSVTVSAVLNTNGADTTWSLEYGATTAYGSSIAGGTVLAAVGLTTVALTIPMLDPATTYHARFLATNQYGSATGDDFTTTTSTPPASPPDISSLASSGVNATSATVSASVDANGVPTDVTVEYGPTTSYGTTITIGSIGSSDGVLIPISTPITGIANSTTVHWRVNATSTAGTTHSADQTFTTTGPCGHALAAPTLATNAATSITSTTVTLNGNVNPEGQATTYSFEYGPTTSYGSSTTTTSAGSGCTGVAASANLSGQTPGAVVHFRLNATNGTGTTHGVDQSITMLTPCGHPLAAPGVTEDPAPTSPASNAVLITGAVTAEGQATTIQVDYGTTTGYGSSTTPVAAGSSCNPVSVSIPLPALSNSTLYHYRITAINATGTTNGSDQTFTTTTAAGCVAAAPTITSVTATPTGVGGTADVVFSINPNGVATSVQVDYGATAAYGSSTTAVSAGSGCTASTLTISPSGLTPNTLYHYRVHATNTSGPTNTTDGTFTTLTSCGVPAGAPVFATPSDTDPTPAIVVTELTPGQTEQITANLDTQGLATTLSLAYGTTTSYGSTFNAGSIGNGCGTQAYNLVVGSLTPNTVYHGQVTATNTAGSTLSGDFTWATTNPCGTGSALPTVGSPNVTLGTNGTTISVVAPVNPNGIPTSVVVEYDLALAAPTITSLSASHGAPGAHITITGTNFVVGGTTVAFHGTPATATVNSTTSITATIPSSATTGTITVTTSGGTATSSSFTVDAITGTGTALSLHTGLASNGEDPTRIYQQDGTEFYPVGAAWFQTGVANQQTKWQSNNTQLNCARQVINWNQIEQSAPTALNGAVTVPNSGGVTITVYDSSFVSGANAAPDVLEIGGKTVTYTGKSGSTFTGCTTPGGATLATKTLVHQFNVNFLANNIDGNITDAVAMGTRVFIDFHQSGGFSPKFGGQGAPGWLFPDGTIGTTSGPASAPTLTVKGSVSANANTIPLNQDPSQVWSTSDGPPVAIIGGKNINFTGMNTTAGNYALTGCGGNTLAISSGAAVTWDGQNRAESEFFAANGGCARLTIGTIDRKPQDLLAECEAYIVKRYANTNGVVGVDLWNEPGFPKYGFAGIPEHGGADLIAFYQRILNVIQPLAPWFCWVYEDTIGSTWFAGRAALNAGANTSGPTVPANYRTAFRLDPATYPNAIYSWHFYPDLDGNTQAQWQKWRNYVTSTNGAIDFAHNTTGSRQQPTIMGETYVYGHIRQGGATAGQTWLAGAPGVVSGHDDLSEWTWVMGQMHSQHAGLWYWAWEYSGGGCLSKSGNSSFNDPQFHEAHSITLNGAPTF